jgi:ketosteroid isomerase-like protein
VVSQENLEIVRRALSKFGDTQQIADELFAPDWCFDASNFQGWPGQQRFTGIQEFGDFFASWTEPYTDWVQEIEQIRDAGPDQVVAMCRQRARLRNSGSWVDLRYGLLYMLSEGLIQGIQLYTPPEDALEAVGLRE